MALTPSNTMPIGATAPDFTITDVITGNQRTLQDLKGPKGTLIAFICNHCPYVKHIEQAFAELAAHYQPLGIHTIAISSNDIDAYPADDATGMRAQAQRAHFTFPYLLDETQQVARSYDAACTPDIYLFDGHLACYYHGRFDASTPGSDAPVAGEDLKQAMNALIQGIEAPTNQQPSLGCNIKYREMA